MLRTLRAFLRLRSRRNSSNSRFFYPPPTCSERSVHSFGSAAEGIPRTLAFSTRRRHAPNAPCIPSAPQPKEFLELSLFLPAADMLRTLRAFLRLRSRRNSSNSRFFYPP